MTSNLDKVFIELQNMEVPIYSRRILGGNLNGKVFSIFICNLDKPMYLVKINDEPLSVLHIADASFHLPKDSKFYSLRSALFSYKRLK